MTCSPHAVAGALAALAALLAVPSAPRAQEATPQSRLDGARACLAALDFACAEAELEAARNDASGVPDDVKVQILALSAQTALATGRQADGTRHLRALLDLAPAFEPAPGAWPASWRAELARAREAMPDRAAPDVTLEPLPDATAGSPCRVTARVSDRSGVGEVALVVAGEAGGGEPERVPMTTTDGRTWSASVPASVLLPPGIAFSVEAFDLKGNGPARAPAGGGLARVPVRPAPPPPPPPPPPKPPLVRQWWLWTIVGGVVAAGAATAAYFLWPRDPGNGSSAPGPGHVNVGFEWSSR